MDASVACRSPAAPELSSPSGGAVQRQASAPPPHSDDGGGVGGAVGRVQGGATRGVAGLGVGTPREAAGAGAGPEVRAVAVQWAAKRASGPSGGPNDQGDEVGAGASEGTSNADHEAALAGGTSRSVGGVASPTAVGEDGTGGAGGGAGGGVASPAAVGEDGTGGAGGGAGGGGAHEANTNPP